MESCPWPSSDPLMIAYHDTEWGTPVHDDRKWFEFIVLDAFQAGLSWRTVLHKRENFRAAFDHFEPAVVARYREEKILELMQDAGIIRNQLKIRSAVINARAFMRVQEEFGSFDRYIWGFTGGKVAHSHLDDLTGMPACSKLSDLISKDLIKRGFKFAGSTIVYAFLQAAGVVNDHVTGCFRYKELIIQYPE
ncbi:MAG: 3-methyladenine DNA glycosylase [Bacteroidetes bacterium GWF2_49_14]|nr:MAG: 3-methyladenine DNA glycosylase [Bacteroidetes bacterium GWF2_49_14]